MSSHYEYLSLEKGEASKGGGHVSYPKAWYRWLDGKRQKVVYKENKNGDDYLSNAELALGGIAALFLQPNLTFKNQGLVKQEGTTLGLLFENICYPIDRRENSKVYYKIEKEEDGYYKPKKLEVNAPEDIPFHFFNQLPDAFFAELYAGYKKGNLSFDMDSLASVLTTSYTLEEDDLHKGNFGFYMTQKYGKPHVVFFKIDHDLMMCDSLMSHGYTRMVNWRLHKHSYAVTPRDLHHFPTLFDSNNYYWPTSMRYLVNFFDSKVYGNQCDFDAFAELGELVEFKQAKWRAFYKHISIPQPLIKRSLEGTYDKDNPLEQAQIALIANAVITRQAQLRAVLFSNPEFRQFIRSMSSTQFQSIKDEIFYEADEDLRELFSPQTHVSAINELKMEHVKLCDQIEPDDTPMHVAIKIGDYRYHESWDLYEKYANAKNVLGETPLDVAIKMAAHFVPGQDDDIRKDPLYIIKHLIKKGVELSEANKQFIQDHNILKYRVKSRYVIRVKAVTSFNALLTLFKDIGEDFRYPLKIKKELSLLCMKEFIKTRGKTMKATKFEQILIQFKDHLNGNSFVNPAPELQFIRQLRSELWIVRQIRGLLGGTATQVSLNECLDTALSQLATTPSKKPTLFQASPSEVRLGEEASAIIYNPIAI